MKFVYILISIAISYTLMSCGMTSDRNSTPQSKLDQTSTFSGSFAFCDVPDQQCDYLVKLWIYEKDGLNAVVDTGAASYVGDGISKFKVMRSYVDSCGVVFYVGKVRTPPLAPGLFEAMSYIEIIDSRYSNCVVVSDIVLNRSWEFISENPIRNYMPTLYSVKN